MAPEAAYNENNMTGSESVHKTLLDTNNDSLVDTSEFNQKQF